MSNRKSDKHPFLSIQQEAGARHLTLVVLPAIGTLYFALSVLWGFPAAENVLGTTSAIAVFLGTILGVNNRRIPDSGEIRIEETSDGIQMQQLTLDATPEELARMKEFRVKVNPPQK